MSTRLILKATAGALLGEELFLTAGEHCVLGRSCACDLCLAGDVTVSREHCMIEVEGEEAWVRDLGSLNGTQVNGETIGRRERGRRGALVQSPRHRLHDGDELRICNNVFRVALAPAEHGLGVGLAHAELPGSVLPSEDPVPVRQDSGESVHALSC
jgi:pSer/pThr/pTyr-binding forkhead associated (FHA) protein